MTEINIYPELQAEIENYVLTLKDIDARERLNILIDAFSEPIISAYLLHVATQNNN